MEKKTTKKKVGGQPRVWTPAQMQRMQALALAGCQNNTIASIMEVPMNTLLDNHRKLLTKKRAERKLAIRRAQNKHMEKNPVMCIFLGKNELDQSDKQDLNLSGSIELKAPQVN